MTSPRTVQHDCGRGKMQQNHLPLKKQMMDASKGADEKLYAFSRIFRMLLHNK
jgi:hypothetical protein